MRFCNAMSNFDKRHLFVACVLNLPLNIQMHHYRSQRARKWSLILAHDSRQLHCAPTYIAVPLLGPHQPWYIESTLYMAVIIHILHDENQSLLKTVVSARGLNQK